MNAGIASPRRSLGRVLLLCRNSLLDELPLLGLGAAAIAAVNLVGMLLGAEIFYNEATGTFWKGTVFFGGVLLGFYAFRPMHSGRGGPDWILLPATPLEKYAGAALLRLLVYPILALAASALLSALLFGAAGLAGRQPGRIFRPWEIDLSFVLQFFGANLVAMAGSARFKKAPVPKTLALLSAYVLGAAGLSLLGIVTAYKSRGLPVPDISFMNGLVMSSGAPASEALERSFQLGMDILSFGLVPLFALVYGIATVGEKEAVDEVH